MGEPPVIKYPVLLAHEDAQQRAAGPADHEPVVDLPWVLDADDVREPGLAQRPHVAEGIDVRVHVYAAVVVEQLRAREVCDMFDARDLETLEGVPGRLDPVVGDVGNFEHPVRGLGAALLGLLPLLRRGIGVDVDGVWLEVEVGGVNGDEDFEVDGEVLAPVEEQHIVDDVGDDVVRALRRGLRFGEGEFGRRAVGRVDVGPDQMLRFTLMRGSGIAMRLRCDPRWGELDRGRVARPVVVTTDKDQGQEHQRGQGDQDMTPARTRARARHPNTGRAA